VLALLELDLGGRARLDDGHAAGELGQALLELLGVVLGRRVLDLDLDLSHAALDLLVAAAAVDDGRRILGQDDLAGAAQHVEIGVLELEADGLRDDLTAREDGHVLEHLLAAVAEAGGLDGRGLEGAADLVDDERGEGLSLDVLGDDQERLAGLDDLLQQGQEVLDVRDLGVNEEDVGLLQHGLLALGVRDEVGREEALVEGHALGELELQAEGVGLLDGDDAFLADLAHGLGDDASDLGVAGRDGGGGGDLLLRLDFLGVGQEALGDACDGLVDALLQGDRVRAGRDVAQALAHERLGQDGGGGGAVAGDVVRLLRDFLDQLGADALVGLLQLDLLGDGHAVVGDRRGAPLLVEDDVAALGAERHLDGVGEQVEPALHGAASLFVERNGLCHACSSSD